MKGMKLLVTLDTSVSLASTSMQSTDWRWMIFGEKPQLCQTWIDFYIVIY